MKRPVISWTIDHFLEEAWCDEQPEFFGKLEKCVSTARSDANAVSPITFLLEDGLKLRVVFYNKIAYIYEYKNDIFQAENTRQIDVSGGAGTLQKYLSQCELAAAA